MTSLEIVLPVYNEEKVLERSVRALHAFLSDNLAQYDWRITIADNASTDQTALIVGMPAHAVLAVAVEIQQHAVERLSGSLFGSLLDGSQLVGPRQRLVDDAGIGMRRSGVTVPGRQPGEIDVAARQPH